MSFGGFVKGAIHSASKYGWSAADSFLGTDFMGQYNADKNFNLELQRQDYEKQLQREIFAREDNAVQRRMADLKAAGFNPLLAAGGASGTGQAVTVSNPQVANNSFADRAIAKAKADADISMTKAQQELINDQAQGVRLQNKLTQKTIDWYDNNPEYAPGVESGIYTGKGASAIFGGVSGRLAGFIDRNITGPIIDNINWSPKVKRDYQKAYDYHIKNGLSPKEAARRASKFVAKY